MMSPCVILRTSERREQWAGGRRCGLLGRTFERHPENDFSQVIGDPDGRGPVENLVPVKIIRNFLSVSASGFVVGQFRPEAVEDRRPSMI